MNVLEVEDFTENVEPENSKCDQIESVCCDVSYNDFFKKYLCRNEPCIIKQITNEWNCQKLWSNNGKPCLSYLESNYGNSAVPVANCDEKYFNSQAKVSMTLSEYSNYWQNRTADSSPCLYLKDWHFMKEYPGEEIYTIPKYFASDWLNEYLVREPNFGDDYRFVYMGPRGSWTPFHSDVFSSFSWSVNICGRKKWAFYRPGNEEALRDKFGKLTYSIDSPQLSDQTLFPHFEESENQPFIVIQEVGDAVFVPSGWHHQVWNIEDTISINHNWINGCNIGKMWSDLLAKLSEVEEEIQDCRDMENWAEHCQLLLKSVHGMDIKDFCSFVFYIAQVRLEALKSNRCLKTKLSKYIFGRNHILFDLFSLRNVFESMLHSDIACIAEVETTLINLSDSIRQFQGDLV